MPKGITLANKVLDHLFGGATYSRASTVYIALYTVAPAADGTGGTEVSGGSYARVAIDNSVLAGNWTTATSGSKSNAKALVFPAATAGWGLVVAFALWDALSGGSMLYQGALVVPNNVQSGQTLTVDVGQLVISES